PLVTGVQTCALPISSPEIDAICAHLDGLPLAIELAASWAPLMTPAEIAEGLSDRFRLLQTGSRAAVPKHETLRASVDWSYALLRSEERRVGEGGEWR